MLQLPLGLWATCGIAVSEDKAGNQEHGGKNLVYSSAAACRRQVKIFLIPKINHISLDFKKNLTQRVMISLKRDPGRMSTGLPALGGSEIGSVCVRGSEPDLSAGQCSGTLTMDCTVISFQTSEMFYLKFHSYFMPLYLGTFHTAQ